MPSGLRADVITHVHMSTISQIPWLEGKEKAFVADVAILLKPRLFMVSYHIFSRFFFVAFPVAASCCCARVRAFFSLASSALPG